MDTLIYLGKLAAALVGGMLLARHVVSRKFSRQASIAQSFFVWTLLFFMGVNTGSIEGILSKLGSIGFSALACTVFGILGTVILSLGASRLFNRGSQKLTIAIAPRKEGSLLRKFWDIFKEPLFLVGIVLSGMVLRLTTPLFSWFESSFVSYLLYAMLACVGMGLVYQNISLKGMVSDKKLLLLPLFTIAGSYLGSLLVPLVTTFTIKESMGIVSGFGWYSLSGIMITDLGYPVLGSVSFVSNLLRESFAFFLIPFFGRLGKQYYYPAVCTAGATSMDVTLPLLSSRFGSVTVVGSIYHGVVMSLVSPLLIPLFF
ncbi:putative membrane protein [Sphaerochaeta pleomorpha str. Grapes]|uniref:Putative membrane protein n=1 Tax=Sphaerochaeta pleomorpha (strain ATCC BAA-1885 / DSM 22778 / Grapes) TaxID=158190 RepID=G8QYU7_SPHPG|nr:lysine exporter LysO family protein [Sphaerochaeta pleomorpha]AEV29724.1 putative membrane protein [Sphaerochaeta pleomorpha str. Grapes]